MHLSSSSINLDFLSKNKIKLITAGAFLALCKYGYDDIQELKSEGDFYQNTNFMTNIVMSPLRASQELTFKLAVISNEIGKKLYNLEDFLLSKLEKKSHNLSDENK